MPDPASSAAYDRYAYVNNNPINFNDPSGHMMTQGCGDGRSACSPSAQEKNDYQYFRQQRDARACQAGNKTYCSYAENHPAEVAAFGAIGFGAVGLGGVIAGNVTLGGGIAAEVGAKVALGPVVATGTSATTFVETANRVCGGDCSDEIKTGSNTVYRVMEHGRVIYVGITKNFNQRSTYWANTKQWVISPIDGLLENLSRYDARAVEQYLIEYYRIPNLENKINSIAFSNPIYQDALKRGSDLLNLIGYFGR